MAHTDPFIFHNGRAAHGIGDLLQVIEESSQAVFEEHVNPERNDFAAWVEHSLHEHALAERLRASTDRIAAISTLRRWVRHHEASAPPHSFHVALQKEFLFGVAIGIVVGIIISQVLRVII